MLPVETSSSSGDIDSWNKSYWKNDERNFETMSSGKERCGNNQISSSQLISFVPNGMMVPAVSFQPGFSHFEPSPNHYQYQFSFPYASPVNILPTPQMLNNNAPSASYVLQDSCIYNGFEPDFNLRSCGIRNPIIPPYIPQDNNFINMRSKYDDSVFMIPSSQFLQAAVPGFAFSVNIPLSRPDNTSEVMQSSNLENSSTWNSCREFSRCDISGHQIFSQSQSLINQRPSLGEIVIIMRKELTKSDVGSIGRIVIPKKDAEANFPPLIEREGIVVCMDDLVLPYTWEFKYRFWPNNKSRMYILENTGKGTELSSKTPGDFVKNHGLQAGDYLSIYKSPVSITYFVKGEKRS